jgi:hypothetical protein
VPERDGLRLHPNGVGRHDGVGMLGRKLKQSCTPIIKGLEAVEHLITLEEARACCSDVLPAATGVHAGDVGSSVCNDQRLNLEVVA